MWSGHHRRSAVPVLCSGKRVFVVWYRQILHQNASPRRHLPPAQLHPAMSMYSRRWNWRSVFFSCTNDISPHQVIVTLYHPTTQNFLNRWLIFDLVLRSLFRWHLMISNHALIRCMCRSSASHCKPPEKFPTSLCLFLLNSSSVRGCLLYPTTICFRVRIPVQY